MFSEDLVAETGRPVNLEELEQSKVFDYFINLAGTWGSVGEAHEFGVKLGHRLLLWLKEGAEKGFIEGTRRLVRAAGGDTEFFTEKDIMSCVMTLASEDWIAGKESLVEYANAAREELDKVAPRS